MNDFEIWKIYDRWETTWAVVAADEADKAGALRAVWREWIDDDDDAAAALILERVTEEQAAGAMVHDEDGGEPRSLLDEARETWAQRREPWVLASTLC